MTSGPRRRTFNDPSGARTLSSSARARNSDEASEVRRAEQRAEHARSASPDLRSEPIGVTPTVPTTCGKCGVECTETAGYLFFEKRIVDGRHRSNGPRSTSDRSHADPKPNSRASRGIATERSECDRRSRPSSSSPPKRRRRGEASSGKPLRERLTRRIEDAAGERNRTMTRRWPLTSVLRPTERGGRRVPAGMHTAESNREKTPRPHRLARERHRETGGGNARGRDFRR